MRVKIKKYPTWFGPYQLVEAIFFWAKKETDKYGLEHTAEWVDNIGEKYANSWIGKVHTQLAEKYQNWQGNRQYQVHIDRWDTWNMDGTLAHIILPMLKQLKATKHGAPNVDWEDVPRELRPSKEELRAYNKNGETDPKFFERWDWVLDEMMFAFHTKVHDNWEDEFHRGTHDVVFTPVDKNGNVVEKEDADFFRLDKGPNDTHKFDAKGYKETQDRIQNGFRLFGKYYQSLWD